MTVYLLTSIAFVLNRPLLLARIHKASRLERTNSPSSMKCVRKRIGPQTKLGIPKSLFWAQTHTDASETHLFISDVPPGRVLDKPWHLVRPGWPFSVIRVEEELRDGEVVRDGRARIVKRAELCHRRAQNELTRWGRVER